MEARFGQNRRRICRQPFPVVRAMCSTFMKQTHRVNHPRGEGCISASEPRPRFTHTDVHALIERVTSLHVGFIVLGEVAKTGDVDSIFGIVESRRVKGERSHARDRWFVWVDEGDGGR